MRAMWRWQRAGSRPVEGAARGRMPARSPPAGWAGRSAAVILCAAAACSALPPHSAAAAAAAAPPQLQLQWKATMRASTGFGGPAGTPAYPNKPGFNGDGCIPARQLVPPAGATGPVANRMHYDGVGKMVAQTNPSLKIAAPAKNTTEAARFDVSPPLDLLIEPFFNETVCYAQALTTPIGCANGSCPATWAGFAALYAGYGRYLNATLLGETADGGAELWQVKDVRSTMVPAIPPAHGVMNVNITRNYTYTVGKQADSAGRRPLQRYELTQSIPFHRDKEGKQHLLPADSGVRDCTVLDFTAGYTAGASSVPAASFGPPGGIKSCVPISIERRRAEAASGGEAPHEARDSEGGVGVRLVES
eukprot:SAG22_NODE_83_length_21704_cov_58.556584_18_plen_362_part_00